MNLSRMKFGLVLVGLMMVSAEWGFASSMVDKHLFTPDVREKTETSNAQQASSKAIKADSLSLMGIVQTKNERIALFQSKENAKTNRTIRKKKGDAIDNLKIQEIGSNYVDVANGESVTRFKLFSSGKNRPAPAILPEMPLAQGPAAVQPTPNTGPPSPAANPSPQPGNGALPPARGTAQSKAPIPAGGGAQSSPEASQAQSSPFGFGGSTPPADSSAPSGAAPSSPQQNANPFSQVLEQMKQNQQNAASSGAGTQAPSNPFEALMKKSQ